jgi:hypothetical protein
MSNQLGTVKFQFDCDMWINIRFQHRLSDPRSKTHVPNIVFENVGIGTVSINTDVTIHKSTNEFTIDHINGYLDDNKSFVDAIDLINRQMMTVISLERTESGNHAISRAFDDTVLYNGIYNAFGDAFRYLTGTCDFHQYDICIDGCYGQALNNKCEYDIIVNIVNVDNLHIRINTV